MIEKIYFDRLIDYLKQNYGIEALALIPLPFGAAPLAAVYKAEAKDSAYFVKLKLDNSPDIGTEIVSLLHDANIPEIISPLKTLRGELIHVCDDCTLIVYPFVEGQNGFCRKLSQDQWIQLGKVIRQVHEFQVSPSLQARLRRETFSPRWQNSVRTLYAQIDKVAVEDEVVEQFLAFLNAHKETILRLVSRAEFYSDMIQKQPPNYVLCHSDIHGGNVLIQPSGAIFIIDWDNPIMAPKEHDLMFIGGGVANVWNDPHEEEFFYKGYGKTEINKEILAYYRLARIVEDVAIFSQELLFQKSFGNSRLERYKQFTRMFERSGVVEIAVKTDNELSHYF